MTDRKFVDFEVPKTQHSRLIGKGGATIKQLQADSGTVIKVPKPDDPSGKVGVEGTQAQIDKVQSLMEGILGMKLSSGPLIVRGLPIPKNRHGAVIGKGGATLKELQAKYGVNITVPRQDDPSSVVSVEGHDKASVDAVEKELETILGMQLSGKDQAVSTPTAQTSTSALAKINLDANVREVLFMPDNKENTKFTRLIQYLASANKSMDVCVFTMTDDRIRDVLMDQVKRGVAVRVISDNEQAKSLGSDIENLRSRGVPLRLDNSAAHMHHKFAVLDKKLIITGSFNWTRQASQENRENLLFITDPDLVKAYQDEFDTMWKAFA